MQIEGGSERMAHKRKVEVTTTVDDESDRVLYSVFRTAAAGLSSLYSQALNHHKVAFDAGQRQALEKLNEWMTMKHQEGTLVAAADIAAYVQNELNSISPPSDSFNGRQNEADLSFSTSLMQSQERDGNAFTSLGSEMEIEESH